MCIIDLLRKSAKCDLRAARAAYEQTGDPEWLEIAARQSRAIENYDVALAARILTDA